MSSALRNLLYAYFSAAQQAQLRSLGLPDVVLASMMESTRAGRQNLVVACAKGYAAKKICEQSPSDPFGLIRRACLYTVKKQFGESSAQCRCSDTSSAWRYRAIGTHNFF